MKRKSGRKYFMSKLIKIDNDYAIWLQGLGERFRRMQAKAATKVNQEMLLFYWSLGKDIVDMKAESKWGSGFLGSLSQDLSDILPGQKGFSQTNLGYMKRFYLLYSPIYPQLGGEIDSDELSPQLGGELICIPWGHHKYIIDKCKKSPEKAIFYIKKVLENNWSRAMLLNCMSTDLYERQGKALSNFNTRLTIPQGDLAQEITKDPYSFDFTNHILKSEIDNPTIGLLICKEKDNILAKYALESSNEPIGISEFELSKLYPKDFKGTLPSITEIEELLREAAL